MYIVQFLLLVAGGFIGGFFGSAAGSAGLVSLPLLLLFGLSPHMAIGTTRPGAVILETVCALRYWREGTLSPLFVRRGLFLGIAGAAGSVTGALILGEVSDETMRLLLSLVITSTTIFLFMKKQWGMIEHPERQTHTTLLMLGTFLAGLYAGFFGFTFGTLIMIVLAVFGYTLLQSAAVGRVIGTLTSSASMIVFAWQGYIDIPYALALAIGFGIGGWIGTRVAVQKGNRYVKVLLVIVVICSVVKLLVDYFYAL